MKKMKLCVIWQVEYYHVSWFVTYMIKISFTIQYCKFHLIVKCLFTVQVLFSVLTRICISLQICVSQGQMKEMNKGSQCWQFDVKCPIALIKFISGHENVNTTCIRKLEMNSLFLIDWASMTFYTWVFRDCFAIWNIH